MNGDGSAGGRASGGRGDPDRLTFGDVAVDLAAFRVTRGGRTVGMGPLEYRLLCFFLRHPRRVFSREDIIAAVWPPGTEIDYRTVDAHVARLRRALTRHGHADPIRTVRTVGYALG